AMSKQQTISPLQVIYGAFPDAVRFVGGQLTRVRDVQNPEGERTDTLGHRVREAVARRISQELRGITEHENTRLQRYTARRGQADEGGADARELDLILPALFDAQPAGPPGGGAGPAAPIAAPPSIRARDIGLIEVTEDARVRTRVFPRSVHCQR